MDELEELLQVEEKLENCYLYLVYLESSGLVKEDEYTMVKQDIEALTKKEMQLLSSPTGTYQEMKALLSERMSSKPMLVNLGYHTEAHLLRLNMMLDLICEDAGVEYANALKYDLHKIILKFLESLLSNSYYEDIRSDLIKAKYDLIFYDYSLEADYLVQDDTLDIKLDSASYKENLPSHRYIDQVILIDESREIMQSIAYLNSDLLAMHHNYALFILKMIHLLSRLALCDEDMLSPVMEEFNYLIVSEEIDPSIKGIICDMLEIFRQIESSFYFSR